MPRLTRAQQAAAGNFGVFPRTASIGTDDPGIAGYAGQPAQVARAQAPAATPPKSAAAREPRTRQTRRRPEMTRVRDRTPSAPAPARANAEVAPPPPPPPAQVAVPPAAETAPAPAPTPAIASTVSRPAPEPIGQDAAQSPVVIEWTDPAPAAAPSTETRVAASAMSDSPAAPVSGAATEPATVADAFDGFSLAPSARPQAASGAVDITRIDIPRERAAPPPPPPPPPHPSRHWVQVATGKDTDALKFDWRRIARKADGKLDGKGPFVTKWVEANRLLAGPYDSAAKAREMVRELKAMGIDSFTFTSAKGERIDDL